MREVAGPVFPQQPRAGISVTGIAVTGDFHFSRLFRSHRHRVALSATGGPITRRYQRPDPFTRDLQPHLSRATGNHPPSRTPPRPANPPAKLKPLRGPVTSGSATDPHRSGHPRRAISPPPAPKARRATETSPGRQPRGRAPRNQFSLAPASPRSIRPVWRCDSPAATPARTWPGTR